MIRNTKILFKFNKMQAFEITTVIPSFDTQQAMVKKEYFWASQGDKQGVGPFPDLATMMADYETKFNYIGSELPIELITQVINVDFQARIRL